ncbi:sensor domain-containing diguanylate cyclase [Aeromonas jandaei]|uniref:sensor domain-containing diguanylate cyclase n=1 Tax=Aeromonas jandaei TaxID=650 RepID=UPI0011162123|nr:sensor domain-containing diguanylate cyclase [Aeromonas jandaei]MBL0611144.1 diguanylate cyclase [Aeromonas jandaei]TNI03610.1 GGDEF domain-containing protein [Aeromonas jandaei]
MQEWDPEHFTNFAQLCEVSLATIRDKTDADYLYLWLKSPEPKLYRFQLEQGLTTLDLAHLDALPLPHTLIDKAIHQGQLMIEPVHQPPDERDESEPQPPRLRACFPLKRHLKLEGVIYLETHRRIDRLSRHQRQGIQLLIHYLTAELSNHLLADQVDQERDQRLHTQTDLVQSQALQGSFLTMLQALHMVSVTLSRSRSENQLLRDAVLLARKELQFDRVAIFLIEPDGKTMRGTWGTSEEGELVDEHDFVSPIPDHPTVQEALKRKDYVLVLEDTPLYYEKQQVGQGWNAMVSLWDGAIPIGWIAADNLLWHRPLKAYQSEIFKQYAAILSQLLIRQRTQEQLERLNRELEERVAERTMQLAETNRALEEANRRLSLLSLEDPLTGIANRRQWDITMQREWEWARRTQSLLAVLMIDVDEFKGYNDHFGHAKGDECLQQVARVLQEAERRRTNLVARYGGEEFVILLCAPQPGEAEQLAERIHEGLSRLHLPHPASRVADFITVSIGFSYLVPSQDEAWQSLTEQADQALYHAKSEGRARTLAYR